MPLRLHPPPQEINGTKIPSNNFYMTARVYFRSDIIFYHRLRINFSFTFDMTNFFKRKHRFCLNCPVINLSVFGMHVDEHKGEVEGNKFGTRNESRIPRLTAPLFEPCMGDCSSWRVICMKYQSPQPLVFFSVYPPHLQTKGL